MSHRNATTRPVAPSRRRTPRATSVTSSVRARSSSRAHSIPRRTRAQCARCRRSSSGAARVYDSPQAAQERSVGASVMKCSCCIGFAFGLLAAGLAPGLPKSVVCALPFAAGLESARRFAGGELSTSASGSGRLRGGVPGGGEEGAVWDDEGDGGTGRAPPRLAYVRGFRTEGIAGGGGRRKGASQRSTHHMMALCTRRVSPGSTASLAPGPSRPLFQACATLGPGRVTSLSRLFIKQEMQGHDTGNW
jgi:hypothetical protein